MIRVLKHGNKITVTNPVTGAKTTMINVVFAEDGRTGADVSMSNSSSFLDRVLGKQIGLPQTRVHTHPVIEDAIGDFPVGKELSGGHINRELYSTPQLRQQSEVPARMIDGKPTYFKTWISDSILPDVDKRISSDVLAAHAPDIFFKSKVGAAEVVIEEQAPSMVLEATETLGQ